MGSVTIAIIAYYREFLADCLLSILEQTYKDIKVIVYDDCSPEDLKSIVDRFDDSRLFYRKNEKNLGTFKNTNQALDLCDSEYINVFHGDDKMFPWMIEKLVESMERYPSAGIALSSRMCGMNTCDVSRYRRVFPGTLYKQDAFISAMAKSGRNLAVCPSALFRKKSIDDFDIRFRPDVGPAADLYCWFEANHKGMDLYSIDVPIMETRGHDKSWSNLTSADVWSESLKEIDDYVTDANFDTLVLSGLREYMAKMDILYFSMALAASGDDLCKIFSRRDYLRSEMNWSMRDSIFNDAVSIGYINNLIAQSQHNRVFISECKKRISDLKKIGLHVPLIRKLKWFINHGVWIGL